MTPELEKQILVAGVGNAWLQDDAFGAEVARRLAERDLPSGVSVMWSARPVFSGAVHKTVPVARSNAATSPM